MKNVVEKLRRCQRAQDMNSSSLVTGLRSCLSTDRPRTKDELSPEKATYC